VIPWLLAIPRFTVHIALRIWPLAFAGLLHQVMCDRLGLLRCAPSGEVVG